MSTPLKVSQAACSDPPESPALSSAVVQMMLCKSTKALRRSGRHRRFLPLGIVAKALELSLLRYLVQARRQDCERLGLS